MVQIGGYQVQTLGDKVAGVDGGVGTLILSKEKSRFYYNLKLNFIADATERQLIRR